MQNKYGCPLGAESHLAPGLENSVPVASQIDSLFLALLCSRSAQPVACVPHAAANMAQHGMVNILKASWDSSTMCSVSWLCGSWIWTCRWNCYVTMTVSWYNVKNAFGKWVTGASDLWVFGGSSSNAHWRYLGLASSPIPSHVSQAFCLGLLCAIGSSFIPRERSREFISTWTLPFPLSCFREDQKPPCLTLPTTKQPWM